MDVYILIDRSYSMISRWEETISAVNAYVDELKKSKSKKVNITVAVFDNQNPFELWRDNVNISNYENLNMNDISPRGMTPLYDAIHNLYEKVMSVPSKKVSVVIVTDGLENGSRITKETAKKYIDEMNAKNYDVSFIGADFDTFAQGASLGGNFGSTLNMVAGSYETAFRSIGAKNMVYASTGNVASFSDEDRLKAQGR